MQKQMSTAETADFFAAAKKRPAVDSRPLFTPQAPAKQLPLLRGLNCAAGQLDLFADMEVASNGR